MVVHSYLEPQKNESQRFIAEKYLVTILYNLKLLGHSYLKPQKPESQLLRT